MTLVFKTMLLESQLHVDTEYYNPISTWWFMPSIYTGLPSKILCKKTGFYFFQL